MHSDVIRHFDRFPLLRSCRLALRKKIKVKCMKLESLKANHFSEKHVLNTKHFTKWTLL